MQTSRMDMQSGWVEMQSGWVEIKNCRMKTQNDRVRMQNVRMQTNLRCDVIKSGEVILPDRRVEMESGRKICKYKHAMM
jgi:hypothetical protein